MRPRPLALVAGGLALAAVLLIGILIGRSGDSDSAIPPVGTPAPASMAPAPGTDPGSSPAPTPVLATLGPVDTEMYDMPGGLRLPRSPTAGPAVTDDFLASGFAHTPLGAAVASVNIVARVAGYMGEPIYRPTIERQVVGPYQQALLRKAELARQSEIPGPEDRVADSNTRIYGFTIDAYTPQVATISYLLVGTVDGQKQYVAPQVEVRWVDEDWRLVAPPNADFSSHARQVTDPSPFHPFT